MTQIKQLLIKHLKTPIPRNLHMLYNNYTVNSRLLDTLIMLTALLNPWQK